jgi:hypothetical protein
MFSRVSKRFAAPVSRRLVIVAALWSVAATPTVFVARPLAAAQPTVEYALGLKPRHTVDYDIPDAAAAKQATLSMEKTDSMTAWVVRSADGTLLRRFADTNGDRVVDHWSYYRDGLEVYRDIDADHNAKPDQARWLGAAGSRWGIDTDGDERLDRWKQLSAEEATAEIVAALSPTGKTPAADRLGNTLDCNAGWPAGSVAKGGRYSYRGCACLRQCGGTD